MKIENPEDQIYVLERGNDPFHVMKSIIMSGMKEDAFYVLDIGEIVRKYEEWKVKLPRVEPYYAVKCNDSQMVLEVLAALGTGFDCASKGEINKVLSLGVDPSRIIYANPAKPISHIRYASEYGIDTMTFDNEMELQKVKQFHPNAQLVIRIRCDAEVAQCQLGMKFGCDAITEPPRLLRLAKSLGLDVIGVSFHVGSGCGDPPVFGRAIYSARQIFDLGNSLGFQMRVLDLGGGYPGYTGYSMNRIAEIVNISLDEYFPVEEGVSIIAEPGRYFVASAFTLATQIHSKRDILGDPNSDVPTHTMYYINDGVYGSFNCIIYDHAVCTPIPFNILDSPDEFAYRETLVPCSVWGPTCDGLDKVNDDILLPEMPVGSWLIYRDMGAYTLPVASTFNGYPIPKVHAVIDEHVWMMLKDRLPLTGDHFIKENSLQSVRNDSWDELPHLLDDYDDIIPYSSYVGEVASAN
uniref:ornithine decarboxylase n=1 Tax=Cacopsylla melanoneura TaxID=428564 RepID=A0A8D8U949_9HEMI